MTSSLYPSLTLYFLSMKKESSAEADGSGSNPVRTDDEDQEDVEAV